MIEAIYGKMDNVFLIVVLKGQILVQFLRHVNAKPDLYGIQLVKDVNVLQIID